MFMAIPEIGCGNISLALQLLCLDEGRCDHQMMLVVTTFCFWSNGHRFRADVFILESRFSQLLHLSFLLKKNVILSILTQLSFL